MARRGYDYEEEVGDERSSLLREDGRELRLVDQRTVDNTELIRMRHEGIQEIEEDVTEIFKIMKDMDMMVDQQGGQLEVVVDQTEAAREKVEDGTEQLRKAERSVQSSRRNQWCLIILIFFLVGGLAVWAFKS
eukprot:Hpha_TRINITY_DN8170_c0_g1::TRINITY_DN8170_c0_g1_i1::g.172175::m.172175